MSGGSIVSIPEYPAVTLESSSKLITEKFEATMGYAADQIVKSDEYVAQLIASITTLGMPEDWLTILQDIEVPTINPISPVTRTRPATLVLPDDWPEDFPNLPALRSVPATDLSYDAPVKPDEVNPTLNYVPGVYNSSLYTAIYSRVLEILENGSSGLNADVEAAILARRREQQRVSNAKKYDDDIRAAGATGFNFPAGMIAAIVTDSSTEVLRQDTDFNNAILIQVYEAEQKAYFFALEKSLNLEQILRDFYGKTEDRSFAQQQAISQFIIQVYAEKIKAYIAEWEGVKTELEAKKATVELVLAENTSTIEVFKANALVYTAKVDSISKQIDGMVKGYAGEVAIYDADTKALEAYYRSLDSQQRLQLDNVEIKLKKASAELDFILKNKLSTDSLKEKIIDTAGHIAQQAVASALNAVNTSAVLSYQGSESRQESIHHSESLNESHSYEEDAKV